ncbi:putative start control protein Cdc10p [[Candida] railenensis]|uniref:Start control protein Cdc10p n=1 Tax=[Candida] railenensis TaxID=45579 RepID=A0A9P0VYX6_9ASCO|nr:putative start control protein Cdc10p [[Candida] railenensis]
MESPINIGDTTTNSILFRLQETHINSVGSASITSNSYSGQQVLQLNITFKNKSDDSDKPTFLSILRRIQDSYINVSQLFEILIKLELFNEEQIEKFLNNEIITNPQYIPPTGFDDFRKHDNIHLRGLWIPYDKAVSLALKFDVYELCKKLFLVDVHDFDKLPKGSTAINSKRTLYESSFDGDDAGLMGSPTKKQKRHAATSAATSPESFKLNLENTNAPFTLPPQNLRENQPLISDIKLKYSEVFKKDDVNSLTFEEIKKIFEPITSQLHNHQPYSLTDLPLDQQGKTALHFASTLASVNLVSSFIKLGLCSPIRGTITGESPLISTITVTNSMEKGNFRELLSNWLYPSIWLLNKKKWSILHFLASESIKKIDSTKYYLTQILEWIISRKDSSLNRLCYEIVNLQEDVQANTCLHLAAENESKWLINILIELNANVDIANKTGLKPIDYDIVKEVLKERENDSVKFETEQESYIVEIIRSNVDILKKKAEFGVNLEEEIADDDEDHVRKDVEQTAEKLPQQINNNSKSSSGRIFQAIQSLLTNTNDEYESLIKFKKQHLVKLNEVLHDTSIVTANNRFVSRKINEKLVYLDNIKLQMGNITDKLELSKREIPEELVEQIVNQEEDEDLQTKYDADEPFRIPGIYDQLESEASDKVEVSDSVLSELPSLSILKARVKAYEEINASIQNELSSLLDYSELTSKFKKVVSFCTGVDINEVDDLLDGLLEAVEGQQ